MMEYRRTGNKTVAIFDAGEELCEKLRELVRAEELDFAVVCSGFGTVSRALLSTYDPTRYENFQNSYYDVYDLASLSGALGGASEPWLDLRAVITNVRLHNDVSGLGENLTDREPGVAYGGTLTSAVVRTSCVVVLESLALKAHPAAYMPPEPYKQGRLERAFKRFTGSDEARQGTTRLEFD